MFTSAKDIMKIIWNGLKEIKKNCSEYCEKDARKIYEETLERVKDELSGPEPEEIRKERLVRNRWEKMRAERKIAAVSILTILASLVLVTSYDRWMGFGSFILVMAAVAVISILWISRLFMRRFKLSLEGWLLEAKEV